MPAAASIVINCKANVQRPKHLKPVVERRAAAFPLTWRTPPINNEEFDSPAQCLERLQAYAFCTGFVVITRGNTGKNTNPGKVFQCIHHDDSIQDGTRNRLKLETRVDRSPTTNGVVSKRQRNTCTQTRGCPRQVRCTHKSISQRGSDVKG